MSLSVQKVYDYYASFYDFLFGRVFQPGRVLSTSIVNQNATRGANILEVGVGTGLSLPLYRSDLNITGIDISEKMLQKARIRVAESKLDTHIILKNMDASNLEFVDESFDFVVGMYVASVVPDVKKFLDEVSRVCKTQGDVIIVNHFISNNKVLRMFEEKFARTHSVVGFKSNLALDSVVNYQHFKLLGSYNINLFGYWKLLHFKKI